jgi:hypothetical protein
MTDAKTGHRIVHIPSSPDQAWDEWMLYNEDDDLIGSVGERNLAVDARFNVWLHDGDDRLFLGVVSTVPEGMAVLAEMSDLTSAPHRFDVER